MSQRNANPRYLTTNVSRLERRARSNLESVQVVVCPMAVFVFAAWLGLTTGLLEVVLLFARRHLVDASAVSALQLNQHARWMIPLSHAMIFGTCGLVLSGVAFLARSRRIVGAGVYGLCFLSALSLLQTCRGLTALACTSLACGISFWAAPCLWTHARQTSGLVRFGLAACIGLVGILFGLNPGCEKLHEHWMPPAMPGAPNVLFIVLDTVRADSLSLYGYIRATSPHLDCLAQRGVRFDHARTPAAWTLPAHASMFTGRWPYELSARPDRPLDAAFPTLAEFLRDHGYATAGFAANTYFCSVWYGLGRGFLHYEDVALTPLEILRSSIMGRYLVRKVSPYNRSRPTAYFERKDAATINREVLDWVSSRPKDRPFFAFLNYYDAHDPYLTPNRAPRHFGRTPTSAKEFAMLREWLKVDKRKLPPRAIELARDCYDDCIACLDDQLGRLFAELAARRLLDNTVVVITADHGELLGEHGDFGHGQSLYRQVVNVPLLIVGPRRVPPGTVVSTQVTTRDLPATIVDLVGLAQESPFPGQTLARHWSSSHQTVVSDELLLTETADEISKAAIGARSARSLVDRNKLYIRNKDGREEMYDLANDPSESRDLSHAPDVQHLFARFRKTMDQVDAEAERLERLRKGSGENAGTMTAKRWVGRWRVNEGPGA
jgi:arylsulfatase A-like enzyme